jgi:hypothetical protein
MVVRTVALPPSPKAVRAHEREYLAGGRSRLTAALGLWAIGTIQLLWIATLGYLAVRLFS